MEQRKSMTFQWLQALFYIHLVSAGLTLLILVANLLSVSLGSGWITWVNRAISLGTILCLFMLPGKFLPGGIARVGLLFCNMIPMLLPQLLGVEAYVRVLRIMQWVSPLLTMLALFLEYRAHGMTVPENAGRWRLLTLVSLSISLVSLLLLPMLQEVFSDLVQQGNAWAVKAYNAAAYLLTLALDVWYLTLLRKNLQCIEKEI